MLQEKIKVIVNPVAGNGQVGKNWPRIAQMLQERQVPFSYDLTEGICHAIHLTQKAIADGYRTIIANGGDGTLNEVLNGLVVSGAIDPGLTLGVIPGGTASDFVRTLRIPQGDEASCDRIAAVRTTPIDIGEMKYGPGEKQNTRFFLNVAGAGFDGEVAERVNQNSKAMGGTITYLTSLVATLLVYRNKHVEVTLDDRSFKQCANSVIVCNGRYFGGGMHIGPDAHLDDGIFDVVILGDLGKIEFLANVPRVYKGTHISHPKVSSFRSMEVHVTSEEQMFIQADGELIGETPITFRMIPRGLRFLA